MTVTFSIRQPQSTVITPAQSELVIAQIWSYHEEPVPPGFPPGLAVRQGTVGVVRALRPFEGPHRISGSGETRFALRLQVLNSGTFACSSLFDLTTLARDPSFEVRLVPLKLILPISGRPRSRDTPPLTLEAASAENSFVATYTSNSPLATLIPIGDNLLPATGAPNAADFATVVLHSIEADTQNRLKLKGTGTVHAIPGSVIPSNLTFTFSAKGKIVSDTNPFTTRIMQVDITNIQIIKVIDPASTALLNLIKQLIRGKIEEVLENSLTGFLSGALAPMLAVLNGLGALALQVDLYPASITVRESSINIGFTLMTMVEP